MKKVKIMMVLLIIVALLLIIPSVVKAADEYTYTDTEQGIEWGYELDDNNNIVKLYCKTADVTGNITIPSEIDGKKVTSLRAPSLGINGIFENFTGITGVVIPNTITNISESAFENCTGLKNVTIPDSITNIGERAFYGCTGLKSITLPNSITKISANAFAECTGFSSFTIPDSVTTIENDAFRGCRGLREITLSKNLTTIFARTFENCTGLTSIIIPDSVTTIASDSFSAGAFYGCSGLRKILIPDSVVNIGSEAFRDCKNLTIYGNEGSIAKEYAEEHDIPFDYIENWDKSDSGSDVTSPTVKSIVITYESVKKYDLDANNGLYMVPAEAKLTINVNFSEKIKGTEVPTLTIKFGDGQNIDITEGTVGGSTITYVYTVKNTDQGTMTAVDYKGGNITDEAGNTATLSCPKIQIQYSSGDFVYANGTATNPDTPSDNNNSNNSGSNNNSNNNNNDGKDNTTAPGKLPQTGVSIGVSLAIIVVIASGTFAYIRYRKLKGI